MSKLIRDGILEIMRKEGKNPLITVASGIGLDAAIRNKIAEETQELLSASDAKLTEEAGDVLESISKFVAERLGVSPDQARLLIEEARKEKMEKRWAFDKNLIWHP